MDQFPAVGQVRLDGAHPMEFTAIHGGETPPLSPELRARGELVYSTVREYLRSAERLSSGKYAALASSIPAYLSNPGNALIAICDDGIVVRFEARSSEKRRIAVSMMTGGIEEACRILSQNLIHVRSASTNLIPDSNFGVEMKVFAASTTSDQIKDLVVSRIWFDVEVQERSTTVDPPSKPYCVASVHNSLVVEMHGVLKSTDGSSDDGQRFITQSELRIAAGWDCIEVFPGYSEGSWKPEYATIWAEIDIQSCALVAQTRALQLSTLDPRASARQLYASLLQQFRELLDSNPQREQTLQTFLEENPIILCPTKVRMWPKLPLGARVTDFVFRDAAGEYLLVELERSTLPLFRQDGHATAELSHAHGQVIDWKRYLEDNLATVQRELGLDGITSNPSSLLVIGRASQLTDANRRKLQAMMSDSPRVKILTYDDLYSNAKAVFENLLGPFWDVGGATRVIYPTDR